MLGSVMLESSTLGGYALGRVALGEVAIAKSFLEIFRGFGKKAKGNAGTGRDAPAKKSARLVVGDWQEDCQGGILDTSLPEEIEDLAQHARALSTSVLRPGAAQATDDHQWSDAAQQGFAELGVRGLFVPETQGGIDRPLAAVVVLDALAAGDAGGLFLADRPGVAAGFLRVLPEEAGAVELAGKTLAGEGLLAVSMIDSIAFLAGKDLASLVVPWAPGTSVPCALGFLATDGLGLVDAAGLSAVPVLGGAFEASGGVEVRVTDANAVRVFPCDPATAFAGRAITRLWAGAVLCGIAQASIGYAVEYGRERVVFGKPVLGHQANAFEMAAADTGIGAARLALRVAAWRFEQADPTAAWLASLAYLEAREASLHATDLGVQMLGGHGYIRDHPAEKWYREARMLALLFGGEDAALDDLADRALDAPDPLVA